MSAAVGGDHQSLSATLLLGTLTLGLGHSLIEEMKRQARRAQSRWTREDTTNAVLLGVWAEVALLTSILVFDTWPTRGLGLVLAVAYIACCAFFVTERRRTLAAQTPPPHEPAAAERCATETARIATGSNTRDTTETPGTQNAAPTPSTQNTTAPPSTQNTTAPPSGQDTAARPSTQNATARPNAQDPTARPSADDTAADGAVLRRRHQGHAPTAGHGPMTRSHAAGHNSTLPAHSHPASLPSPATFTTGRAAAIRSEAPR
ncbi:hypothetical protein [Actinoplanes solisilvae]|uniref:hypothetical protein n=1 Tax=Actinoplanes solisilvae TaxID=2486853 RepID=UPI00196AEFB2|nr:hypothetical protein [Actinoplanes solisilvae]